MKQKIIAAIVISWLCGLTCCHVFTVSKSTTATSFTGTKQIAIQLNNAENLYREKANKLELRKAELDSMVKKTTIALHKIKKENNYLKLSLQKSISLQQQYNKNRDTGNAIVNCDSLSIQAAAYMQAAATQDNIQEAIKDNLSSQLRNRDSLLLVKDNQYKDLRMLMDNSLLNQKMLEGQLIKSNRKAKRRHVAGSIKNIGLLVISGLLLSKTF